MTIKYMLDTNICIYIAKKQPEKVLERFKTLKVGSVSMSIVTLGELTYGIAKSQHPKKNQQILDAISKLIPALPMPQLSSNMYSKVRAGLERKGTPIGNNDLWIAAHALSLGLTLVSNNTKEFQRVPNLKLENWA